MAIQPFSVSQKKKILVLVSRGGGGHKTAGDAIQQILGDSYDVEINYVLETILKPMDFLNLATQGRFTGEDLYNFLLQRHQQKLLQWMLHAGKHHMNNQRIEKIFDKYLRSLSQLPDLIISPTPFINYGIACAAHRYDIPFIVIPTDLDGSTFLFGFPKNPTPLNFKLALPYDDPWIRKATLQNIPIRDDQIAITGFPVRPACHHKYSFLEKQQIRAAFQLFESHSVITLIMGAVGGNLMLEHVRALTQLDPRVHGLHLQLNVCTGHNQKMASKIKNLLLAKGALPIKEDTFILPSGLVIHLRGYVSNLIDLMAVSDLIITKTGSCTVNEAIYLEKKMILDNTEKSSARCLPWEQFNIPFIEKYGLGLSFSDSEQLPMLVPSLLKYPDKSNKILHCRHFGHQIAHLVAERMIAGKPSV